MVSIVMPAYNEAEIIETTIREWYDAVVAKLPGSELLVVDDCSKDGTARIVENLARELQQLRLLRPERNVGHGGAIRFGFGHVTQEFVFQTDSDRQHVPADFWKLWNLRQECDFVFGVRRSREDGGFRIFITRTMRMLNFLAWGLWIADANCPFKLMRRKPMQKVLQMIPQQSFIPMVMVSILARKAGFRVCEVPVTHLARKGGQQSLKGIARWIRVSSLCCGQLVRLRFSYRKAGL
jgi:glycosyltransferase involved in cell wall biosynthesis